MSISAGSISSSAGPLDVSGLVNQLISVESRSRLTPLKSRENNYNALISAYGALKGALSTYQAALRALDGANFSPIKSTLINNGSGANLSNDHFSVETGPGSGNKGRPHVLLGFPVPVAQRFFAGDTLGIKIGNKEPTFITLKAPTTLTGLRDLINAAGAGVRASTQPASPGNEALRLESDTVGEAGMISMLGVRSLADFYYDPFVAKPMRIYPVQMPRDPDKVAPGAYNVAISRLAQADKLSSVEMPTSTFFNKGMLAIKVGNDATTVIRLDGGKYTLAGLSDLINSYSEAGVTASVVNIGLSQQKLVLTAKQTGAANAISLTGTEDAARFNADPSGQLKTQGMALNQTFSGSDQITLRINSSIRSLAISDLNRNGKIELDDVAAAINNARLGVTASVERGVNTQRLTLSAAAPSNLGLGGAGSTAILATNPSMARTQTAQDATLTVDGNIISSASNKVTDAVAGATLTLKKPTAASDKLELNLSNDTAAMSTAVSSFVNAYNTLVKAVGSLTRQSPSAARGQANLGSPLAAEASVRAMMGQIRSTLLSGLGEDGKTSLSQVGIVFQKDGTLALNSSKLAAAAERNFAAVGKLFSGPNGVLTRLDRLTNDMLGDNGVLASKTRGLQKSLKIVSDQQAAASMRLQNMRDSYTNQFNRLNTLLATMAARQNYLTQQLDKLDRMARSR
ncbi:flagellar filament capping protein FliD [Herbaspirillum seropedicae]|uniref:flagellar filament capping protein FliD n=1 Tax=Herbaspirillum seropedicae TaxID=964 RepID=UPI0028561FA0|nr:flagellar filament capping protein FliD [Herbaspirillum seropedicae]MDR6396430.1 flagellar hook-associated protein 2 [Herbaspirillum seropedicae]